VLLRIAYDGQAPMQILLIDGDEDEVLIEDVDAAGPRLDVGVT